MIPRKPPAALKRPTWMSALVTAGLAACCLLSSGVASFARPPAQPGGPVAPLAGTTASATSLALALIPWTAYAAAASVIFGGTVLFAFAALQRESKARSEQMGQIEIDLLVEHAAAFAVLYERYCARFSAQRPLWVELTADERKHSRWIGEFPVRIRRGEGRLRRELFPYGRVANARDQLQLLARDAAHADLAETTALRNVLQQENERAEWSLPNLFAVSSAKFGTTLELLQSEAQAHQLALSGAIEQG